MMVKSQSKSIGFVPRPMILHLYHIIKYFKYNKGAHYLDDNDNENNNISWVLTVYSNFLTDTVSDKYCYHAHFTDGKTKAQRKNLPRVTGPVIEAGLKLWQSGSRT